MAIYYVTLTNQHLLLILKADYITAMQPALDKNIKIFRF